MRSRATRGENEDGMVTAELAIASLGLVAVAAAMVGVFGMLLLQVRCTDSAAEIARQAARGDSSAVERVSRNAPPQATVSVTRTDGGMVRVRVAAPVRPVAGIPVTVEVVGQAATPLEPGIR